MKYIQGNLFDTNCELIAHGVNCSGGFGSGVAGQIAKLYPIVKESYLYKFKTEGWKLGDVQFVQVAKEKWIANCATQQSYLPRGICHLDYNALYETMLEVEQFAISLNLTVAIPKIGAGLAGGDWNKIELIIKDVFDEQEIMVYYQ